MISLAPNLTEILFAAGCGAQVIAVDDHSDHPSGVEKLPRVGGLPPSVEKITALRPDLVVASSAADQRKLRAALANVGIPLYVADTDRVARIPIVAREIGAAIKCQGTSAWATTFDAQLAKVQRTRQDPPKILYLAWPEPLYVAAEETFADDVLRKAGAVNAVRRGTRGWPQYSLESVVANPPDVILFPTKTTTRAQLLGRLRANPKWSGLAAVREGRVLVVDENTFNRPGPRIVEAITILNRELDALGFR